MCTDVTGTYDWCLSLECDRPTDMAHRQSVCQSICLSYLRRVLPRICICFRCRLYTCSTRTDSCRCAFIAFLGPLSSHHQGLAWPLSCTDA